MTSSIQSPFLFRPSSPRWMLLAFNGCLAGLLLYQLGNTASHFIKQTILSMPMAAKAPVPVNNPKQLEDAGQSKISFDGILERNIFGASRQQNFQKQESASPQMGHPKINYELRGTAIMKNAAYAFLAKAGKDENRLFWEGNCMSAVDLIRDPPCSNNSAQLIKINDRAVTLQYHGQEIPLVMKNTNVPFTTSDRLSTSPIILTSNPPPLPQATLQESATVVSTDPPTSAHTGIEETIPLSREWVDAQLHDFGTLLNTARIGTVALKGKVFFQLKHIQPGSVYEKLGLEKRDIILSINGSVVDTLAKAMALFQKLRSEREIALKIEREGRERMLRYIID